MKCNKFLGAGGSMSRLQQSPSKRRPSIRRRRRRSQQPNAAGASSSSLQNMGTRRRRRRLLARASPSSCKKLAAAVQMMTPSPPLCLIVFLALMFCQHNGAAFGWVNQNHYHPHHTLLTTQSGADGRRRRYPVRSYTIMPPASTNVQQQRQAATKDILNDEEDYEEEEDEEETHNDKNNNDKEQKINDNDGENANNDDSDTTTYKMNLKLAILANECAWLRKHSTTNKAVTVALQAVRLLRSMKHPDTVAFNSVLKALAKLSPAVLRLDDTTSSSSSSTTKTTAAQLALDLLQEMKQLHKHQVQANQAWYQAMAPSSNNSSNGSIKKSLTQDEISAGPPRIVVKPNVRTYSTVMDALGRTGTYEAAEQAHELLWEMSAWYNESSGDATLQPNLITYNTLLSAYAKCCATASAGNGGGGGSARGGKNNNGASSSSTTTSIAAEAADQCVQILLEMPIQPDVISYNAVLHALAGSGHENAGERAEELLRSMTADVAVARPNARSYTTCMNAWGQSGYHAERAHALLTEMLELYDSGLPEYQDLAPNAVSYATVIHAYAVSKTIPDKALMAYSVFQDMMKRGIVPNLITFNTLLNTCAMSKPVPETFVMVEKIYDTILRKSSQSGNEHEQPDQFTFGTVLKACAGNLYWRNTQFAPAVFAEACRRGQVSRGVLQQFRQAVSVDTYRRLVSMTRNKRSNDNDDGISTNINKAMMNSDANNATSQQQPAADSTSNGGSATAPVAAVRRQYSNYTYLDDQDVSAGIRRASSAATAATVVARRVKNNNYNARRRDTDDYVAWTDLPYEWRRNVKNDRDRRRRR